ncbi:MAG: hypothetical protein ACE3JQ_01200 [Paenisporosarcina sp.]
MTNKPSVPRNNKDIKGRKLDNPDLVDTEKESLFDMHEDMQTVDAVPVDELNEKIKDEADENHRKTKDTSSSEKRYPD